MKALMLKFKKKKKKTSDPPSEKKNKNPHQWVDHLNGINQLCSAWLCSSLLFVSKSNLFHVISEHIYKGPAS